MKLLTFAHRGEAQHFLKTDNYKSIAFSFKELYKNKENFLLITGEGIESTTFRMKLILEKYNNQIAKVINIGIAGALNTNLKLGSIHSINKVFSEEKDETFLSVDSSDKINCVTAKNQVLDKEYAEHLSKIAPIVDMELWACAKVCNIYDVPFQSFKIISDYAGKSIGNDIIKKAKLFSEKLYNYYMLNVNDKI